MLEGQDTNVTILQLQPLEAPESWVHTEDRLKTYLKEFQMMVQLVHHERHLTCEWR